MARADAARRVAAALVAVCCAVGLVGCGLQGPLYLPGPQSTQKKSQKSGQQSGQQSRTPAPAADPAPDQAPPSSP